MKLLVLQQQLMDDDVRLAWFFDLNILALYVSIEHRMCGVKTMIKGYFLAIIIKSIDEVCAAFAFVVNDLLNVFQGRELILKIR